MKSIISLALTVVMLGSVSPSLADQYLYEDNRYHFNHKHKHQHQDDHDSWQLEGEFEGGFIDNTLNDRRYLHGYPRAYQKAPRWAGPRYCESILYYDSWGNLVREKRCYR